MRSRVMKSCWNQGSGSLLLVGAMLAAAPGAWAQSATPQMPSPITVLQEVTLNVPVTQSGGGFGADIVAPTPEQLGGKDLWDVGSLVFFAPDREAYESLAQAFKLKPLNGSGPEWSERGAYAVILVTSPEGTPSYGKTAKVRQVRRMGSQGGPVQITINYQPQREGIVFTAATFAYLAIPIPADATGVESVVFAEK